jgi:hypothetical protein
LDFPPERGRRDLNRPPFILGDDRAARIEKQCNHGAAGDQFVQQFGPLLGGRKGE